MGFFDRFKGGNDRDERPPDTVLKNLAPGWMVDYDLKTWEVTGYNTYDWGGDLSREWQLTSGDEVRYLELETDDEDDWSLNRVISFHHLGPEVKKAIMDNGDPPEKITYEGVTYYLEEMSGGHFQKGGAGEKQELLSWSYEDDDGRKYLTIEQWGEEEFETSTGFMVEEYQFTNILPRA